MSAIVFGVAHESDGWHVAAFGENGTMMGTYATPLVDEDTAWEKAAEVAEAFAEILLSTEAETLLMTREAGEST
jgi:hypothetical protein